MPLQIKMDEAGVCLQYFTCVELLKVAQTGSLNLSILHTILTIDCAQGEVGKSDLPPTLHMVASAHLEETRLLLASIFSWHGEATTTSTEPWSPAVA